MINSISTLPESIYVDINFVANAFGYKAQTLRKWIYLDKYPEGFPRPEKVNKRNLWFRKDIEKYFSSRRFLA
ncbi:MULTISPECIES: hypothetical protein [Serratia]|uniref:hypothetical protein n=1 Tax=Serratia TaxID=613 RepID=UPI00080B15A4|nr:hypothetical protein [Serratia sp. 506_PEND]